MNRSAASLLICFTLACALATAAFADPIELRLKDGTRWRGQVNDQVKLVLLESGVQTPFEGRITEAADLYLTVEGKQLGKVQKRVIFKSDIVSISTVEAAKPESPKPEPAKSEPAKPESAKPQPDATPSTKPAEPPSKEAGSDDDDDDAAAATNGSKPATPAKKKELLKSPKKGVFMLTLKGMVGLEFRHQEMRRIAKEADKYGPGQIIVLLIDSGGGRVDETEQIHKTLTEIKKRHRLVAWIQKAISAACATALHCDEIYFMTEGTAGSMTAFAGTQSWQGEELQRWLKNAGDWAEAGGRSRYIAEAMIHAPLLLSYDKDATTGEVTWHNDLSGQYILSREHENLTFNSSNAVHCKFADGIADTKADLAKLLDLPEWYEITNEGQTEPIGEKISEDWVATVEKAQKEIPLLFNRYQYKGTGTGDPRVVMGTRKSILEQLIQWWDRCPNACEMSGVPPKKTLEREVMEIKRTLSEMQKRRY